jgi:hypothetical protein
MTTLSNKFQSDINFRLYNIWYFSFKFNLIWFDFVLQDFIMSLKGHILFSILLSKICIVWLIIKRILIYEFTFLKNGKKLK